MAAVVLAAGSGRRYGRPKALVDSGSGPWVLRALDVVRQCDPRVVVVGAAAEQVAALLPADAVAVRNPEHATGMGSSLRVGLQALVGRESVDAAVIMLVDLPGVGPAVIDRVLPGRRRVRRWPAPRSCGRPSVACLDIRCCSAGSTGRALSRRRSVIEERATTWRPIRPCWSSAGISGRVWMWTRPSRTGRWDGRITMRTPHGSARRTFRPAVDQRDQGVFLMAVPGPGYSITMRIAAPPSATAAGDLTTAVGLAGGVITGFDVVESTAASMVVDISANAQSQTHADELTDAVNALPGVEVRKVSDRTFLVHIGGKIEVTSKVPLRNRDDLSRAYTPGVARVCMAIANNPSDARRLTIKRNTVAVVTDGTAVLGLGNIGPAAALPVMEGKAALFKKFAGVDAWPVCLDTTDTEEIIRTVQLIAPVYGGINLEDIAAPRCFEIEARLRELLDIPVFHDDQHGTAIVVVAALRNALRVVGKDIAELPDRGLRGWRGRQRHHPVAAAAEAGRHRRLRHRRHRLPWPRRHGPQSGRRRGRRPTCTGSPGRSTTRSPGPTSSSGCPRRTSSTHPTSRR